MEETKNELVKAEFSKVELFQIHLSLVARQAEITTLWANCVNAADQKKYQDTMAYLAELTKKVDGFINGNK